MSTTPTPPPPSTSNRFDPEAAVLVGSAAPAFYVLDPGEAPQANNAERSDFVARVQINAQELATLRLLVPEAAEIILNYYTNWLTISTVTSAAIERWRQSLRA